MVVVGSSSRGSRLVDVVVVVVVMVVAVLAAVTMSSTDHQTAEHLNKYFLQKLKEQPISISGSFR